MVMEQGNVRLHTEQLVAVRLCVLALSRIGENAAAPLTRPIHALQDANYVDEVNHSCSKVNTFVRPSGN
jgi:hypothetical protein